MIRLRFYVNKSLDKRMVKEFISVQAGGVNFGQNIIKLHPRLRFDRLNKRSQPKIIDDYFDVYYKIHKEKIKRKINEIRREWIKWEENFVSITEKYFGGFKFSKGRYIAYPSIINCNPRFLDSKTFQFFYKKEIPDAVHTIAHELLHFIFFDFVNKKLPKIKHELSDDELWDLSEIFNVVLLRMLYKNIINHRYIHPYPDHKKYLRDIIQTFLKSTNIKEFIIKSASVIRQRKTEIRRGS
ncbi:MAG: hypothetical protein WC705_03715 [Candidatus Paceibacterota bacterium]|jgi:hypothetical protein